jgi:type III secretion protein R
MSASPATWMVLLAGIGLLPFVAIMLTSFVKMAVVFSMVRNAIGTPQIPPSSVVTGLALVLSISVMTPVVEKMGERLGGRELSFEKASVSDLIAAARDASAPLKDFLKKQAHPAHVERFGRTLAEPDSQKDPSWRVLVPAFVVSELEEAFKMGFVIFLPFLVLDLLIGSILLSLGMHMLSPTTVSLPFKVLLFVFADGWSLIGYNLLSGYR